MATVHVNTRSSLLALALVGSSGCYVSTFAQSPEEQAFADGASSGGPFEEESTGPGGERSGEEDDSQDPGPAVERSGEELFMTMCSGCHGADAWGTASAYEIRHPIREYARFVVRGGRSSIEFPDAQMPAFTPEALSDSDLDKIFDYLNDLPQPTTGEELFLDYCRNCHGEDGRGGVVGVSILAELDPNDDDSYEDLLEDTLDQVRDGDGDSVASRGSYMPSFDSSRLTSDEVVIIVDYLASL